MVPIEIANDDDIEIANDDIEIADEDDQDRAGNVDVDNHISYACCGLMALPFCVILGILIVIGMYLFTYIHSKAVIPPKVEHAQAVIGACALAGAVCACVLCQAEFVCRRLREPGAVPVARG